MSSGSTEVLRKIIVVRDVSITSFDEKLQHQSTFLEPTQNVCLHLAVLTGQTLHARDLVYRTALRMRISINFSQKRGGAANVIHFPLSTEKWRSTRIWVC